ncbi:MAG: hypothetical protein ACTSPB_07425 [Candidatus Thorarchaeota archaeon]
MNLEEIIKVTTKINQQFVFEVIADPDTSTASYSNRVIRYNPALYDKLSDEGRVFLFSHELSHVLVWPRDLMSEACSIYIVAQEFVNDKQPLEIILRIDNIISDQIVNYYQSLVNKVAKEELGDSFMAKGMVDVYEAISTSSKGIFGTHMGVMKLIADAAGVSAPWPVNDDARTIFQYLNNTEDWSLQSKYRLVESIVEAIDREKWLE